MALQNILTMVKLKLPFLPDGSTLIPNLGLTVDDKLNSSIFEQYYYLQGFTKLIDADVDTEANYNNLQKMLITELVCYYSISDKALVNVAGTNGASGTAGKRIKKGKADVVEAEFDYGKSSDGTFLGMTTEQLMMKFAQRACEIAALLKYNLPLCEALGFCKAKAHPMPFMVFPNKNINKCQG